jgi:hypothetical protein
VGAEGMGEGPDQTHWNYWRRELYVYESGLLDHLPAGLAAPRCYGLTELPGETAWLWLEEISDDYQGDWPLERYVLTARHLGLFNSAYLTGQPLPEFPWLSQNFTRQWLTGLPEWLPLFFDEKRQDRILPYDGKTQDRILPYGGKTQDRILPYDGKTQDRNLPDDEKVQESI